MKELAFLHVELIILLLVRHQYPQNVFKHVFQCKKTNLHYSLNIYGYNGQKKLLCGNVRNFSMIKNGCAHRVQHTRISLGPNFGASSSLIFKDF